MSIDSKPNPVALVDRLGRVNQVAIAPLAVPGQSADAAQADAGAVWSVALAALFHIVAPSLDSASPSAPYVELVAAEDAVEAGSPEDDAADRVSSLHAFIAGLDDLVAQQAYQVTSLPDGGPYLVRAPAEAGIGDIVAIEVLEGWVYLPLRDAFGNVPARRVCAPASGPASQVVQLQHGQLFCALDMATGRHFTLTRADDGALVVYRGALDPAALLAGLDLWNVTQPEWLNRSVKRAREDGGLWRAAEVLGLQLRAGAQPALRTMDEMLGFNNRLHGWAVSVLPEVGTAGLVAAALESCEFVAAGARRLVPPQSVLGSDADLDPEVWDGDTLSAAARAHLAELLAVRDALENVRALLALVDASGPLDVALEDADAWLLRAAERAGVLPRVDALHERLEAVWRADPNAWWAAT